MRFKEYIKEETVTTDVETGTDAVTSNKMIKIFVKDSESIMKKLLVYKYMRVKKDGDGILIEVPTEKYKETITLLREIEGVIIGD